jgi:hypothetical protein
MPYFYLLMFIYIYIYIYIHIYIFMEGVERRKKERVNDVILY